MPRPKTHAQLVDAAITDCRISAGSRQAFLNALAADPDGTKRVLAALTPLPANLRRPGKQMKNVDAATSTEPRVTGSDEQFERIEFGREPTEQEKLDDVMHQMTFGALGNAAPAHGVYFRDKNDDRLVINDDGTGYWDATPIPGL
jgi:hypothetical protein